MICLLWAFKETGEESRMARLLQYREKRAHTVWAQLYGSWGWEARVGASHKHLENYPEVYAQK